MAGMLYNPIFCGAYTMRGTTFVKESISKIARGIIRKYDVDWFVNFLKIAQQEDGEEAVGIGDAMRKHAWVATAVDFRADNISRPAFNLFNGDTVVESGPVYKLFNDVNPDMSQAQLFRATEAWLGYKGEAFWAFDFFDRQRGAKQVPSEIYVLPPANMKHHVGDSGRIEWWTYENGQTKMTFHPDEIIHFLQWNPWDARRGVGRIVSLSYELAMDYNANKSNLAILRNSSVPDGVLSSDQHISKDNAEELRDRWYKDHQGASRSHRLHVLGQGTTYQAIQLTPRDLEYDAMKRSDRTAILARLGVPGALIGATDEKSALSGSDTQHQQRNFWNTTLLPEIKLIEDKLRTEFFTRFHVALKGEFDLSEIQELQDDQDALHMRMREDIKVGLLTINEARAEIDMEPIQGGDIPMVPMSQVQLGVVDEPAVERSYIVPVDKMLDYFPEDTRVIAELLPKAPRYTTEYKDAHWKAVVKGWESMEVRYMKKLREWVRGQRAFILETLAKKDINNVVEELHEEFWREQTVKLRKLSHPQFRQAMSFAESGLVQLFGDVNIPIKPDWTIFDTQAVEMVERRVNELSKITTTIKGQVGDTISEAIAEGLPEKEVGDLLRDRFNLASNRMETVARTEIGNVLQDSRMAGFIDVGVTATEWLTARDGDVRPSHQIDGEVAQIGQPFSNSLLYPNDPSGAAGEVINCRCVSLPVMEE